MTEEELLNKPKPEGWNAQDTDLEGRLWTMPSLNINGTRHVSVENVLSIMYNAAIARHAYKVEILESHKELTSSADEQVVQDVDGPACPMCDCVHPQVAHSHSGCKVRHVQANGFFLYCACRCNFGRQFEDSAVAEKYSTRV